MYLEVIKIIVYNSKTIYYFSQINLKIVRIKICKIVILQFTHFLLGAIKCNGKIVIWILQSSTVLTGTSLVFLHPLLRST